MAKKSDKFRIESDLLGELQVPKEAYYGVQTQRGINNYRISNTRMCDYPDYVIAMAYTKWAAIKTNNELGVINNKITKAVEKACKEIVEGKMHDQFPTDMVQGGAGTSVNMNANEVIANRALEIMGYERGDYKHCSPNDHINCGQSTNDAYPTALHYTIIRMHKPLVKALQDLVTTLRFKGRMWENVIKMGRTQLQDGVPMSLGQEFTAFANWLSDEVKLLHRSLKPLYEINMGGTAIGTGLNAAPGFPEVCAKHMAALTGEPFVAAKDLIAATPDTGPYVNYSASLKHLAVKLSKICNDLRLLASGPCCGLHEINLPAKAPGSSIMPGKVNPVIPEVTNQVCFKVIGNDVTVSFAAEAGQLQLNVMEPVILESILESMTWLTNAINTLRTECVEGITPNKKHTAEMVKNSIGIVTALNPYIGYKASTKVAKKALETGKSVYSIVLKEKLMDKKQLDEVLNPKNMLQ